MTYKLERKRRRTKTAVCHQGRRGRKGRRARESAMDQWEEEEVRRDEGSSSGNLAWESKSPGG